MNPNLLESESLLPAYKQNGSEERPVAYDLGQALSDLWDKELMYLSPHDTTPVSYTHLDVYKRQEISRIRRRYANL